MRHRPYRISAPAYFLKRGFTTLFTLSAHATADLVVITGPESPTLTVRPACSVMTTSVTSPMITYVVTPLSIVTSSASPVVPSTNPLMSIMTIRMETSSSAVLSSLIKGDFEKEFITKLVDSFYKSLR